MEEKRTQVDHPVDGCVEIGWRELVFYLLKRWKSLLVCVIVAALLAVAWAYHSDSQSADAVQPVAASDDPARAFEKSMTWADVSDMRVAAGMRATYERALKMLESNPYMQFTPDSYFNGRRAYAVLANEQDLQMALALYQRLIEGDALMERIASTLGLTCELSAVRMLTSCNAEIAPPSAAIVSSSDTVQRSAVITYGFNWSSEEECQQILDIIDDEVRALQAKYADVFANTQTVALDVMIRRDEINALQRAQDDQRKALTDALEDVVAAEKNFSDAKRAYYENVFLTMTDEEDVLSWFSQMPEDSSKPILRGIILVFLAGLLWGGCCVLRFLLDQRVYSIASLCRGFRLPLLGRYVGTQTKKRCALDRQIERWEKATEPVANSQSYLLTQLTLLSGDSQLAVCADAHAAAAVALRDALCAQSERLSAHDLLQQDESALRGAKEMQGIVLLVQLGVNTEDQVKQELALCRLQKLPFLGFITVE